jgi:regulator of sirC expression with transglutaminase-like and TPR domain
VIEPGSGATARFRSLVERPAAEVPLDEVVALVGAHAEPHVDVLDVLADLDELAASCPVPTFTGILRHLAAAGFVGNTVDYADPANSYLHRVLTRRTGIPITLSVVAIEVGRRLGVDIRGVGMPGHFLVRDGTDDRFGDPFHGGAILDAAGCERRYRELTGRTDRFEPSWLAPSDHHAVVLRVLANLKGIFVQRQDTGNLLWVQTLRCAVPGVGPDEHAQLVRLAARFN